MRGLYAIVDTDSLARRGVAILAYAEALLRAQPIALQLRSKSAGARETLAWLRAIAPIAKREGVPLYANDRPDLAILAGADGVHVGQEDLSPEQVRQLGAELRVGLSTHDPEQVRRAVDRPIDYLAVGPVFATQSKERPSPTLGIDGLAACFRVARDRRPELPIVAIGGVTLDTAADVGELCDAVAVIGALSPTSAASLPEVTELARAFTLAISSRPLRR